MKAGDVVYYKGKKFLLIEELSGGLVRIKLDSFRYEERVVEKKYLKTKEQYEREFKDKPFGRHDVWIN